MRLISALAVIGVSLLMGISACPPEEEVDNDGDGYAACPADDPCDCDDNDKDTHPGAEERCNGKDDNCDGDTPAEETTYAYEDSDWDTWGSNEQDRECNLTHAVSVTGDCDDSDANVNPSAPEVCDEDDVDEDCDGQADDDDANIDQSTYNTYYEDNDGDSYGSTVPSDSCELGPGQSTTFTDCDDTKAAVNPGVTEVCGDVVDNDCDDSVDEGFDADGDGYKTCVSGTTAVDCDDGNSSVHPNATEVCNSIDDDCDNTTDEGFDTDHDGYATCGGDCNDNNASIHPGADDSNCNGIDEDCDGVPDDGNIPRNNPVCSCTNGNYYQICSNGTLICPPQYDLDTDQDTYSTCESDCNDSNASIHPNATELVGDSVDQNCDGKETCYYDPDNDGYLPSSPTTIASSDTDCNDKDLQEGKDTYPWTDCRENDPISYPGAAEVCDGIDNDCDGTTSDEGADDDHDGYKPCLQGDCDDTDPSVYPGATEVCDGKDNNCDGTIPEDLDKDGFTTCTTSGNAFDCNDNDALINACFGSAIFGKNTFAKSQ